jgi:hypothetical protein
MRGASNRTITWKNKNITTEEKIRRTRKTTVNEERRSSIHSRVKKKEKNKGTNEYNHGGNSSFQRQANPVLSSSFDSHYFVHLDVRVSILFHYVCFLALSRLCLPMTHHNIHVRTTIWTHLLIYHRQHQMMQRKTHRNKAEST